MVSDHVIMSPNDLCSASHYGMVWSVALIGMGLGEHGCAWIMHV